MGEPRPLMGEPRGPLMDGRGKREAGNVKVLMQTEPIPTHPVGQEKNDEVKILDEIGRLFGACGLTDVAEWSFQAA